MNGSVALRDCLTNRNRCPKTVRGFQVGTFSPIYNKLHTEQNMAKQRINPLLAQKTQIPRTPSANAARVLQKLHNGRLCRPMSLAGSPQRDCSLLPASNNHRRFFAYFGLRATNAFFFCRNCRAAVCGKHPPPALSAGFCISGFRFVKPRRGAPR